MNRVVKWVALLLVMGGQTILAETRDVVGATLVPCAGPRFQARELPAGSVRASGFHLPERNRAGRWFAWARSAAEVWFVLDEREERRRLVLTAAGVANRQEVRALVNGVELGEGRLDKNFAEWSWQLPRAAVQSGLNRVVLKSDTERRAGRKKRRLSMAIDELRVEPDASECVARSGAASVELPVDVAAGTALVAPLRVPPEGRLRLGLSGAPGAVVDILVSFEEQHLVAESAIARGADGGEIEVALPLCCGVDRQLMIVPRGPDHVRLETLEVAGEETAEAWREACGRLTSPIIIAIGLGGLFLLAAWRGWTLPLGRWAPWVDVLVIVAVAMLVRYLYLAEYPDSEAWLSSDSGEYLSRARSLAGGHSDLLGDVYWHRWQTWLRPPGYYFFLAQLFKLGVESVATVVRLQTALWVGTAVATYALGHALLGRGAALFAGLYFALNLEGFIYGARIGTEALFMPLLVPALALLAHLYKKPSFRLGFAAGLLFGLAALVRSAPLLFVPLAALSLGLGQGFRRALRPMAALVLGAGVVIVPWCVRNSIVTGRPMGIDNILVPNFLYARPDERYVDPGSYDPLTREGEERYAWRVKRSGELLASKPVVRDGLVRMMQQPWKTAQESAIGLKRFFRPRNYRLVRHMERQPCRIAAIVELVNWQTYPVLILGLVVMFARFRDRSTWPISLWFLVILVSCVLLIPLGPANKARYRFSTLPVLLVYAGWGLCYLQSALARYWAGRARSP